MSSINHPTHYNMGGEKDASGTAKYETIKVIEDWGLDFCLGNALKYILRAPYKGTEMEDLLKARWYLNRLADREPVQVFEAIYSKFTMSYSDVSSAWGLPPGLQETVKHIRFHSAKLALLELKNHIESIAT